MKSIKDTTTFDRYVIVADSETGHCCFTHSVIDSLDKDEWRMPVCETFREEDAVKICEALNKANNV